METENKKKKTLLSCKNAAIGYDNKIIINHLTVDIMQGDYVCILGENGSGKSTLIKTILGLQKVISGEILLAEEIKNGYIGYLPQQTQAQRDFPASAYEIVLSGFLNGCKNRPFYNVLEKKKAFANMELLKISDLKNRCYRELSGGQQQRVLLARALCAARNLLVLDEPVTGLDPNATLELYDNLQMLNKDNNMTIVMVSHDINNVLNQANQILHLDQQTWFYGTQKEYLDTKFGVKYRGDNENAYFK